MRELPVGTVTFLFTDIEGSTRLLQDLGERYAETLATHRRVVRTALAEHGGVEVDTQGDAFFAAFADASDAVAAAQSVQCALASSPVRVRMGLHTGEPVVTAEGYVGIDVHRGARICAAGHGGQVLLSRATAAFLGSDVEVRDLGEHRLKDLPEAEWLLQLIVPGLVREFPPLRSLSNTNLPAEASSLIGRQQEVADLAELIERDDVRLVTLTGAGGTGKTRLALRIAAASVERFKNGVFVVWLAAITEPQLILPTIAQTVGVKLSSAPGEDLARHLAGKSMLLLLDNFEQVLEAAPDVGRLLAATAQLKVVITSRERMRLSGEHEYPVQTLGENDAVSLFAERASGPTPPSGWIPFAPRWRRSAGGSTDCRSRSSLRRRGSRCFRRRTSSRTSTSDSRCFPEAHATCPSDSGRCEQRSIGAMTYWRPTSSNSSAGSRSSVAAARWSRPERYVRQHSIRCSRSWTRAFCDGWGIAISCSKRSESTPWIGFRRSMRKAQCGNGTPRTSPHSLRRLAPRSRRAT